VGVDARVDTPIKIMIDEKYIKDSPNTYEDWYNLGYIIIPCENGRPTVKKWSDTDFKITKEEWKDKHLDKEIGLRLDNTIDLDLDHTRAKVFAKKYLTNCNTISGREHNPTSHYWFKGKLPAQKFSLPNELKRYVEHAAHGQCLCEIRSTETNYTIVPGSLHSKHREYVRWEKYEGFNMYVGDLNKILRKIALATALSILYAPKGQRDEYCTAIAGVLIKQTNWEDSEINDFIYDIAVESNDDEAENRKNKGSTTRASKKPFGMPKLAEIIECRTENIASIFSWIGVQDKSLVEVKQVADESIGEIIEYGQNRYKIKVTGKLEGNNFTKDITIDGPTLMNQKAFYDAVVSQAQVWMPKMKVTQFEEIMKLKFESRVKSDKYVEEANENLKFIKYFKNYIRQNKASVQKKELANYGIPYYNLPKQTLEFDLDSFEDYLHTQKINLQRVDLVMKIQDILKAKKNRGKYKNEETGNIKSLVSWKIDKPDIANEDIEYEGEIVENKSKEGVLLFNDFEKDRT